MPPGEVARRAASRALAATRSQQARRHDSARPTYLLSVGDPGPLNRIVDIPNVALLAPHTPLLAGVTSHYLEHRFDLLGSGWVEVRHGMDCVGVEGHQYGSGPSVAPDPDGEWLAARVSSANASEARRLWRLVDTGYQPIDWQLDFKSGWRWSESTWYRDITYGSAAGVDVKVPWELARLQHLPQLALAAQLATRSGGDFAPAGRYVREFRNQVLDFLASNPPRFGVNWTTAMDVAIRAVNLIVARDLFISGGHSFDVSFERVFRRSIVEHGLHLAQNLEWDPELRGNHYLADIVGLLFIGACLPRGNAADAWLAFAVEELLAEIGTQFAEDGSNFEASTCYHRLSAEMAVYGAALILGMRADKSAALEEADRRRFPRVGPRQPKPSPFSQYASSLLPRPIAERLERMAEFVVDITKPQGGVPQIGDNDSGRFIKLIPIVAARSVADVRGERVSLAGYHALSEDDTYWDEDFLDHRHIVASINGLFRRADLAAFASAPAETEFVSRIASGRVLPTYREGGTSRAAGVRIGSDSTHRQVIDWIGSLPQSQRRSRTIRIPLGARPGRLRLQAYPDFGLFIARSGTAYVCIRCGPIGQNGFGGHAHNDQLSIELAVDGRNLIRDPGSYLYTPLPGRRDEFRSAAAHFGPRLHGPEPASLKLGLFRLGSESNASCLYWGSEGFVGRLISAARSVTCSVEFRPDGLVLSYGLESWAFADPDSEHTWQDWLPAVPFSPGYGILERTA